MTLPKIAYAANRKIGYNIEVPLLLVPNIKKDKYIEKMINLVNPTVEIMEGKYFRSPEGIHKLKLHNIDYFFSVHFPYIITREVLEIPKIGTINLHPSYLPYNKGWHTPSWAIYEETVFGATFHWVDEGIDTGDIISQKKIEILPNDTADSIYKKVHDYEIDIMREMLPLLIKNNLPRIPQESEGTAHIKSDLEKIREIKLKETLEAREIIKKLRALTTNKISEAAYFIENNKRYLVRIEIIEED